MNVTSASAKRLMRDWREIQLNQHELPTITACPLENNIYEWHCTINAPSDSDYYGIVLHLKMLFPENYPSQPPKVSLMSRVSKRAVFYGAFRNKLVRGEGFVMCLDILETHEFYDWYSGWSAGYTVMSILLQLQSYLLERDYDASDTSIIKDISLSHQYSCSECGHSVSRRSAWPWCPLWDPLSKYLKDARELRRSKRKETASCSGRSKKKVSTSNSRRSKKKKSAFAPADHIQEETLASIQEEARPPAILEKRCTDAHIQLPDDEGTGLDNKPKMYSILVTGSISLPSYPARYCLFLQQGQL